MTLRRVLIGGGVLLVLWVIVLAFLIGLLLGRGEQQKQGSENKGAETTQTTQAPQAVTAETTAQQKEETTSSPGTPPRGTAVALGETATFPDRTVTVNDIQRGYVFPSNIPAPSPGNEYILVNVTITNTSSQPIDVNSYNFESEDPNGVRYMAVPTNTSPDAINTARVAPNGELTGNLVFEVEQGVTSIKIVYQPR